METDPAPVSRSVGPNTSTTQPPHGKAKALALALYHRYEKYTEPAIFCLGFLWDSITLTRVDSLIDNVVLLLYLAIIGTMIVLTLRRQCGAALPRWMQRLEPRFPWAMQFCFGGLFSSYVVFYFKSASWTRTQFFFLVLIFLWIGNEFLQDRLRNPVLLASLYSFCLLSFFAFFLPVVLAKVNAEIFVLAGLLSLAISLSVFAIGFRPDPDAWRGRMRRTAPWITGVVLAMNLLYFANLVPPVPLALKSAGIYHRVEKTPAGYVVQYVDPPLWRFWKQWDDPFYLSPGESAFCYTAIFAPGKVRVPVFHVWSRRTGGTWKQTDRIRFQIIGGREGGYRGFTAKTNIVPGKWRVEAVTERDQILGRIDFTVSVSPVPHPPLHTKLIR